MKRLGENHIDKLEFIQIISYTFYQCHNNYELLKNTSTFQQNENSIFSLKKYHTSITSTNSFK